MHSVPLKRQLKYRTGLTGLAAVAVLTAVTGYSINRISLAGVLGDANGDGLVNITDLSLVLSNWNKATPADDFNNDGAVNVFDLSIVLNNWGKTASTPTSSATVQPSAVLTPTIAPTPTPSPVGTPASMMPTGVTGAWTLKFDDEFNGTSLDHTKWDANWYGEGGNMNGVGTYAANTTVSGGTANLVLASSGSGALIHTNYTAGRYSLPVGGFTEARVQFAGSGSTCYNWAAWWASGPSWPSAGEHDIAEVLSSQLTVNYHSPSGSHNQGAVPGSWCGAFHTYGLWRKSGSAEVYWDGVKVKSYSTDDNHGNEELIFNVGKGSSLGAAGMMKVDYVRAWQ